MYKILSVGIGLALLMAAFGNTIAEQLTGPPEREVAPPARVAMATTPQPSGPRLVALQADNRGHFTTDIQMNGQFLKAMVDTGASVIALSAEDAKRAGLKPTPADFTMPISTANGVVRAAKMRVAEVRLQSLVVRDVETIVMPQGALAHSLLGMSFLKRLASFEMQGKTLVLKQ
jgi:aspartyl protease family protein